MVKVSPPTLLQTSATEAPRAWRKLTTDRHGALKLRAMLATLRGIVSVNDDADLLFGCEVPLAEIKKLTQAAGLDCPITFYLDWDGCEPSDGQGPVFNQERIFARQPFLEMDDWPPDRKMMVQTLDRWIATLDGFAASFIPDGESPAAAGGAVVAVTEERNLPDAKQPDPVAKLQDAAAGGGDSERDAGKTDYPTPDNYERDRWVYEQRQAGRTIPEIQEGLSAKHGWEPLYSPNGIREAVKRYANHLGVSPPKARSGKPRRR